MTMYQEGYEVYLEKCEQFGLEPTNFRYYIMHLSYEQLHAFNEQARAKKGRNEG
ncbi:MAG: transcriptional regulator [Lysinibacillus sp.]